MTNIRTYKGPLQIEKGTQVRFETSPGVAPLTGRPNYVPARGTIEAINAKTYRVNTVEGRFRVPKRNVTDVIPPSPASFDYEGTGREVEKQYGEVAV